MSKSPAAPPTRPSTELTLTIAPPRPRRGSAARAGEERGAEVRVEHEVPGFVGQRVDRAVTQAAPAGAGDVDQGIEPAEVAGGEVEGRPHLGVDVEVAAGAGDAGRILAVETEHARPAADQLVDDRPPDPLLTGDRRPPPLQQLPGAHQPTSPGPPLTAPCAVSTRTGPSARRWRLVLPQLERAARERADAGAGAGGPAATPGDRERPRGGGLDPEQPQPRQERLAVAVQVRHGNDCIAARSSLEIHVRPGRADSGLL